MIEILRRDARIRSVVLNITQSNETDQVDRLCRKNSTWVPERASREIEGAINRFEFVLRKEFTALNNKKSLNLTMAKKIDPELHQESKGVKGSTSRQKSGTNGCEQG